MSAKLLDLLKERFGEAVLETSSSHGDETAVVDPSEWLSIARFLCDDPRSDMKMMVDLCAVDFPDREPRFEVVMHLHSLALGHRLRLKARVGDKDAGGAEIESVTSVWRGADWFERETFDLMGIAFRGHPDLRRILLYPEFVGHPLRKDYPADKTQPLVPLREGYDKLAPFDANEGMPFGRASLPRGGKVED
jgi:NADH-quinone oxidoreductase subunit C